MIFTDKPNDREGIFINNGEDAPKAFVTRETVTRGYTIEDAVRGMGAVCNYVDRFVQTASREDQDINDYDALLIMVNHEGRICVYDSMAQRGGRGVKKRVEVHRLKLFIALLKALPGLCTDLLSFLSSQVDEEPHPTAMPLSAISSKAAYKLLPESFKQLYKEIQTIQM